MTNETNNDTHTPVSTDVSLRTNAQMKMAAAIILSLLALGFIVVGVALYSHETELSKATKEDAESPPVVQVVKVENAPMTESLNLPGETHAWYETTLYARVSGYVANWKADIGDHVKKGDVLATIDTPDLDAQLAAAQAKINVAKSKFELAKSDYRRVWDAPKGIVSDQERDQSKAEVDSAEAQMKTTQAEVDNLTALTQFKNVAAPFDGTITARRIDIGQLVTAGSTSNTTSLYSIAQTDKIRVFVRVPESSSAQMKEGTSVSIHADEFPDENFTGNIIRSTDEINPVSKTLRIEVDISNEKGKLMPGMYVHADFQLEQKGLLRIPASALIFRTDGPLVAIVNSQNKIEFHKVTIARDEGDFVDVTDEIKKGQYVALNIGDQIASGDKVTPDVQNDSN